MKADIIFRALNYHERDVIKMALQNLVAGKYTTSATRISAQYMLDQHMVDNFLWTPEREGEGAPLG